MLRHNKKTPVVYLGEAVRRQRVDDDERSAVVDVRDSDGHLYAGTETYKRRHVQVESVAGDDDQWILVVLFIVDWTTHQQFTGRPVHGEQRPVQQLQPRVTTKNVMFCLGLSVCWLVCLSVSNILLTNDRLIFIKFYRAGTSWDKEQSTRCWVMICVWRGVTVVGLQRCMRSHVRDWLRSAENVWK